MFYFRRCFRHTLLHVEFLSSSFCSLSDQPAQMADLGSCITAALDLWCMSVGRVAGFNAFNFQLFQLGYSPTKSDVVPPLDDVHMKYSIILPDFSLTTGNWNHLVFESCYPCPEALRPWGGLVETYRWCSIHLKRRCSGGRSVGGRGWASSTPP